MKGKKFEYPEYFSLFQKIFACRFLGVGWGEEEEEEDKIKLEGQHEAA